MPELGKHSAAIKKASKAKSAIRTKTKAAQSQRKINGTSNKVGTQNLVVRFLDRGGKVIVERVAKDFRMSKGQLAQTVGLSREALYKESRLTAPKTQARCIFRDPVLTKLL